MDEEGKIEPEKEWNIGDEGWQEADVKDGDENGDGPGQLETESEGELEGARSAGAVGVDEGEGEGEGVDGAATRLDSAGGEESAGTEVAVDAAVRGRLRGMEMEMEMSCWQIGAVEEQTVLCCCS